MTRLRSVAKWIGLYLLANLAGAVLVPGPHGSIAAAVIFATMIVYAVVQRRRRARA